MQLVGRKNEIKNLEWDLQKSESQFVAIYGRRRIGKTYLIREMFSDTFTFSHTGFRGGDKKAQLAAFRSSLVRFGRTKCPVLRNWLQAFDELYNLIADAPSGKKVVFIDELPTTIHTHRTNQITRLRAIAATNTFPCQIALERLEKGRFWGWNKKVETVECKDLESLAAATNSICSKEVAMAQEETNGVLFLADSLSLLKAKSVLYASLCEACDKNKQLNEAESQQDDLLLKSLVENLKGAMK